MKKTDNKTRKTHETSQQKQPVNIREKQEKSV